MFLRILNKLRRESYKLFRPILWGRSLQINGIPTIGNIKRLELGYDVSLNSDCYIQCVGGVKIDNCVTISQDLIHLIIPINVFVKTESISRLLFTLVKEFGFVQVLW